MVLNEEGAQPFWLGDMTPGASGALRRTVWLLVGNLEHD
jgi:hypothetical protein